MLSAQFPALAALPLTLVDEGWDNVTFLLGTELAVRLPRRELAVKLLLHEQLWLPVLADRLLLKIPVPIHFGQPDSGFPWPWSIVRWIPGTTADSHDFSAAEIQLLVATLQSLHQPASSDAPENPFRGVPLHTRHPGVVERLIRQENRPEVDAPRLAALWEELCSTPASTNRVWLHGDLHPRNVIIRDGTLVGLIDWGDLNGGDAATDLACAWLAPRYGRETAGILFALQCPTSADQTRPGLGSAHGPDPARQQRTPPHAPRPDHTPTGPGRYVIQILKGLISETTGSAASHYCTFAPRQSLLPPVTLP